MKCSFLSRVLLLVAVVPASSQAALVYSGFGSSTVGAVAPAGWTRVTNTANANSAITADHYFQSAATTTGQSTLSLYNTGAAIDRGAGNGFQLTSTFTATSGAAQYENTAFNFMSSSTGDSSPRLIFNMGSSGTGLLEFANMSSQTNGTLGGTAYNALESAGALYTFTLTGIFNAGGAMDLTATLTNSVNGTVVTSTATLDTVAAGNNYFGIRTATGGDGTGNASATYQTYLLETIPEPSHALLALGGGLVLLARRRR